MKSFNLKLIFILLLILSNISFANTNKSSSEIQSAIKQLCADRYRSPGDFTVFANKLKSLGVVRQTYDTVNDDLAFYSKDKMLYHLAAADLNKSITKNFDNYGQSLNIDRLRTAIAKFDADKLSVTEFHKEVARSGIVYVMVYLDTQKIYYLSQDGKYYLETY